MHRLPRSAFISPSETTADESLAMTTPLRVRFWCGAPRPTSLRWGCILTVRAFSFAHSRRGSTVLPGLAGVSCETETQR